jgi:hypothetical protein
VNINDLTPEPGYSVPEYPEATPTTAVPNSDHGTAGYWRQGRLTDLMEAVADGDVQFERGA